MYPNSYLPPPLSIQEFYVLLALSRSELHAYAIIHAVQKDSLGSINLTNGRVYKLVSQLHDIGLIDMISPDPAEQSTKPYSKIRVKYSISTNGHIRLQEEMKRLDHAVGIGKATGLLDNPIPTDIQRLILDHQLRS